MKILLLGSQHGNELLGEKLYDYIETRRRELLPYVAFKIANPKAHEKHVRFIESDMNRSYDQALSTYEAACARDILAYSASDMFDLVLDLHTTVCEEPPCFIIEAIYPENKAFLCASSIDKIVLMQHPIVRTSLIGVMKKAISIEVANDDIHDTLLDELCNDIDRFIHMSNEANDKSVYTVSELLLKSSITEEAAARLTNFTMSDLGFIPILVGEGSYKKDTEYLGFKSGKETRITL